MGSFTLRDIIVGKSYNISTDDGDVVGVITHKESDMKNGMSGVDYYIKGDKQDIRWAYLTRVISLYKTPKRSKTC